LQRKVGNLVLGIWLIVGPILAIGSTWVHMVQDPGDFMQYSVPSPEEQMAGRVDPAMAAERNLARTRFWRDRFWGPLTIVLYYFMPLLRGFTLPGDLHSLVAVLCLGPYIAGSWALLAGRPWGRTVGLLLFSLSLGFLFVRGPSGFPFGPPPPILLYFASACLHVWIIRYLFLQKTAQGQTQPPLSIGRLPKTFT